MYSFLVVLTFSIMVAHRCLGEDEYSNFSSTEAVKFVIVENVKENKESREIIVEREDPEHYSQQSDNNGRENRQHDYYLEEDEDVILHDNNGYDLKNIDKHVDVGVQVQGNTVRKFHDSEIDNFGQPQKYNIDVTIRKEPPRAEKDKENILVRLVKNAMKYTG